MEIILYTAAGIVLYFLSDFILVQAELWRGKPFKQRNIIFFIIISILAVTSFQIVQRFLAG